MVNLIGSVINFKTHLWVGLWGISGRSSWREAPSLQSGPYLVAEAQMYGCLRKGSVTCCLSLILAGEIKHLSYCWRSCPPSDERTWVLCPSDLNWWLPGNPQAFGIWLRSRKQSCWPSSYLGSMQTVTIELPSPCSISRSNKYPL